MNDILKKELILNEKQPVRLGEEDFDTHIEAANRHPRDLNKFLNSVRAVIQSNEKVASQCFYALQRRNRRTGEVTKIEGPGVRLAELMQMYYRNLSVVSRVVEMTDRYIKVQAIGYDAETLNRQGCELVETIVDREGRRYNEDMISNIINAAMSKARRNVIFSLIPRIFAEMFVDEARKTIREGAKKGGANKVRDNFLSAVSEFQNRYNVGEKELLNWLKKGSVEEVTPDDIVSLRGLWSALEDNDTTLIAEGLVQPQTNSSSFSNAVQSNVMQSKAETVETPVDIPKEKDELVNRLNEMLKERGLTFEQYKEFCVSGGLNFVSRAKSVEDISVGDLRILVKRFNIIVAASKKS